MTSPLKSLSSSLVVLPGTSEALLASPSHGLKIYHTYLFLLIYLCGCMRFILPWSKMDPYISINTARFTLALAIT
jgi:hypothetical protein